MTISKVNINIPSFYVCFILLPFLSCISLPQHSPAQQPPISHNIQHATIDMLPLL